ncbi:MAE_28990/MAE_18760 family HEPN-like nuclease [Anaerofustis stercorihominis]|uniref:RiboL-PSP-HEPN domain-containing protein n=1 Tax=Anaerofustis stercorihominis TaxID=214853 RepID=A0A3E3DUD7_9FIRM|nr:MAE_28990/MAE_18760 family HEPN-like nuclease [Anaerofustis stercorihominis]RGD72897.1 hypothetical protein DW687_11680 [Anaerofustis stercorihominis]
MLSLEDFRADMEESLTWRIEEYTLLKNTLRENNKNPIVKTLIVMLYAHFEGFFKDCLECYIKMLNSTKFKLEKFCNEIVTASLSEEFSSFENINKKCKVLITVPPYESYLHKFHRRRDLTIAFRDNYIKKEIRLKEKIINTKSNLSYATVQENLYILGLDYNFFEEKKDDINCLLNLRNAVAHGSRREPIDYEKFKNIETKIINIMNDLIVYLYQYCYERKYLINNKKTP